MKSFPRFWRNHPYLRNKWYLIWPCCLCSLRQSKRVFFEKKNQNDQFKKPHFLPPPIPNIFSWKFLYLIGLIDTKGIGVDSLCRTASLLRIGGAGKLGFFESAILIFFFFKYRVANKFSDTWNQLFVVNCLISNFFCENTRWKLVSSPHYLKILIKSTKHGLSYSLKRDLRPISKITFVSPFDTEAWEFFLAKNAISYSNHHYLGKIKRLSILLLLFRPR